jgi:TPR repeat
VTLLLVVASGIIFGRWLVSPRTLFVTSDHFGASAVDGGCPAGPTDRSWSRGRPRLRMAVASALLALGVAARILAVQSHTVAPTSQAITPPGSATGAEFYLQRGEDFSSVHQYDRAIADYTTAIQLKPDYAEAYNDRGFAYYLNGHVERAIADYTRAIELRPDYPKAYNSRGVAYMAHGYGAAKSVPDFDRAIALKPDFRYAYINRANARLASHPWLALQDFHRAGMYPERTVAILGGAVLTMIVGVVWIRRRALCRRAGGAA